MRGGCKGAGRAIAVYVFWSEGWVIVAAGAGRIITPQTRQAGYGLWVTDSKDTVKKTFQLNIEGKNRDRVLEATKHDIRQYVKRERRKALPEGVDYWDFDCKFGTTADNALDVHFATLTALIDAVTKEGAAAFYLELLAKPGYRGAREPSAEDDTL